MLLGVLSLNTQAQHTDYVFRHITVNDGLINNIVTAVYNDSYGFVWIGTQGGLQRYDGTRFKNYLADIRDTSALQTDWISSIYEDSKKRFWIGTDLDGPYILNRATGKFYNYNAHQKAADRISGSWHFAEDKFGVLWIAGHDGCYRFNESSQYFEKYNAKMGIDKHLKTGTIFIDGQNNCWVGTNDGLQLYNQKENKLYNKDHNPAHNPLLDVRGVIGNVLATNDEIWMMANKGIYRYNFATLKFKFFQFKHRPVNGNSKEYLIDEIGGLFRLEDGKIIAPVLLRGLAFYQPDTDDFLIEEADNAKSYGFHVNRNIASKNCFAQDHEKNILIGNEAGVQIFNPLKQVFKTSGRNTNNKDDFPAAAANDFLEMPDGNIFVGYYNNNGGIVKMDSSLHFKKQYLYNVAKSLTDGTNQVWNLFKNQEGNIWAPNQNSKIVQLNVVTEKITVETQPPVNDVINMMKQGKDGTTWIASWKSGLGKIDKNSHQLQYYTAFLHSDSNDKKRINCILPEGDKLWTGTLQNGLQLFDVPGGVFVDAFTNNPKNNNSISSNCITEVIRYNKDTLLVATLMGINIFDEKHKTFKTITTRDGLPNNLVQSIIKDAGGDIWVACYDNGFCKLNIHSLSVVTYGVYDGITDDIFSSKFYQLHDGRILIGASGSFISFNPSSFALSVPPADVHITGFHVFEKEVLTDSLIDGRHPLKLEYYDNSIRIEFSSLQYWGPAGIKYYYKLTGVDKNWILADNNHAAVYNQLKNGDYVFQVKCASKDGIYCLTTTELKIRILPPFWQTWWFLSIAFLCAGLLVYTLVKWRENNFKAIATEKLKVQQLNAEQYRSKLEMEKIVVYFSSSLIDKNTVDDVLWDVAKNLIGRLDFVDCMIYLWNDDKTKMIQKAGFGPKGSVEEINKTPFDVLPGQGVVGYVMQTKESVLINNTANDDRYRADDLVRLSELTVPVIYNKELIGVIDSEHYDENFFTPQHLHVLNTIATLVANKIKSIEAEQSLQQTKFEMYSMNEQLLKAKLEALRSQMNPHFIFNSLNAIQECILTNNVDAAYKYLSEFSKLQRMVLNNSEKELIPLSSEIEMLQLYLSLESLRFSKSFSYSMDMKAVADPDEVMIPSLITQPLVENAIWHGLRNKEGIKTLAIVYEELNGTIFITIEDNGIGRERAADIKSQKLGSNRFGSKGTMMLQQRLSVLSQHFNATIAIQFTDKADAEGNATGTKIVLSFPANLEIAD